MHYEPEVSQALGLVFAVASWVCCTWKLCKSDLNADLTWTSSPRHHRLYEVLMKDGTIFPMENPSKMPDLSRIEEIREPIVTVNLFMPQEYVGSVMTLYCTNKRGVQTSMTYHSVK